MRRDLFCRTRHDRRLGLLMLCVSFAAVGLLATGVSNAGGPVAPRAVAESTPPAVPPDGLLSGLASMDSELSSLATKERTGDGLPYKSLGEQVNALVAEKRGLIEQYFNQDVYGVRASEAIFTFDCIELSLREADLGSTPKAEQLKLIRTAARCKDKLQRDLRKDLQAPGSLLDALARGDKDLTEVEDAIRAGRSLKNTLKDIGGARYYLVEVVAPRYFTQVIYGAGTSQVPLELAIFYFVGIDSQLDAARDFARKYPHGGNYSVATFLETAQRMKVNFEHALDRAVPPTLSPIHAVFTPAPPGQRCSPPYCTTVYTEVASLFDKQPGEGLQFVWTVAIPNDPGCARGFQPSTPDPDKATWYHADESEGGPCNHAGGTYNATGNGHPGLVTVTVSDADWACIATFNGTQGPQAQPTSDGPAPEACQATPKSQH